MSRSAAALAYTTETYRTGLASPADTASCRVLGGTSRNGQLRAAEPIQQATPRRPRPAGIELLEEEQYEPFLSRRQERGRQAISPLVARKLAGGAAVLIVLLAIGSPVLARGVPAADDGLMLSLYSEPGRPSKEAPVIDVTTGPAEAASAEAPAEQPPAPVPPEAPAPPVGNYSLEGPPSTSVRQIEEVLAQYGSPAAGHGQALYDLGVRYNIDPAYALAFFVHESGCGTKGVARFTKSLGNIRWTEGFESYEGYRSYPTWEAGMEDWYRLITDLYIAGWNLRTVDQIIPVYAPWGDNNHPPTYIASVKNLVDSWRGK